MPIHPDQDPHSFSTGHLPSHDYAANDMYFVTLYANQRQPHFALPALVAILHQQWQDLPQRFAGISLDRFVITPNQLHFIIWVKKQGGAKIHLSEIIRVYKSITAVRWTQYLRETNNKADGRIWQKGHYERIIWNEQELERARRSLKTIQAFEFMC